MNATVEWNCPSGPCNTSSGQSIFFRRIFGDTLIVTVVNPGDNGTYSCFVTDDSGNMTDFDNYDLNINGGHTLTTYIPCACMTY